MVYEKSCGAVVYTIKNNEIQYLIVKNILGHYGFSKGHVEGDESEVETALREIKEETGLHVRIDSTFKETIEYYPYFGCTKEVVYFIAFTNNMKTKRQQEEIKDIQWVTYEQAQMILDHNNDRNVLVKAHHFITMSMGKDK